jgi:shikimate kinase
MKNRTDRSNIVLIGMPGVGKSTAGVLLAKTASMGFVDTDVVIQTHEGRRLQDIIDMDGLEVFREIEERHVLQLDCENHVVATGGSVVYSEKAMDYLKSDAIVVYLSLSLRDIEQRLTNLPSRGVVKEPRQTLASLFRERTPLYLFYADVTVDCAGLSHEQVVHEALQGVIQLQGLDE